MGHRNYSGLRPQSRYLTERYVVMTNKGYKHNGEYPDCQFVWNDEKWLSRRRNTAGATGDRGSYLCSPLNIYEVHLGTFKPKKGGQRFDDRTEAADELITYVKQLGYTHILLLDAVKFSEHDGFVTVNSSDSFRYFANKLHLNGIGIFVRLDFPKLAVTEIDGTVSDILRMIRDFHIDGISVGADIRVDNAVGDLCSSINYAIKEEFPDVITVYEDEENTGCRGMEFDLTFDTKWANDGFSYINEDPFFRKHHHNKITVHQKNAAKCRHILPISRNAVSNGKKSLLDKNFGDYYMKFAGFRTFLAYMMTCPGKKLMFMGCEFAPFKEWSYNDCLEWFMTDFDMHRRSLLYTAELNRFYLGEPALWERDFSDSGFEFIYEDLDELNIIAFKRFDKNGNLIVVLINFAPVTRECFTVCGLPGECYKEVFSSDDSRYGGSGQKNTGILRGVKQSDGSFDLSVTLPGLGACILKPAGDINI